MAPKNGVRAEICASVVASAASVAADATDVDVLAGLGGRCGLLYGALRRDGRFHGCEAADADLLRPRDGDPAAAEVVRREQPPFEATGERYIVSIYRVRLKGGPKVV